MGRGWKRGTRQLLRTLPTLTLEVFREQYLGLGTVDTGILFAWLQWGFDAPTRRWTEVVKTGVQGLEVAVDFRTLWSTAGKFIVWGKPHISRSKQVKPILAKAHRED